MLTDLGGDPLNLISKLPLCPSLPYPAAAPSHSTVTPQPKELRRFTKHLVATQPQKIDRHLARFILVTPHSPQDSLSGDTALHSTIRERQYPKKRYEVANP